MTMTKPETSKITHEFADETKVQGIDLTISGKPSQIFQQVQQKPEKLERIEQLKSPTLKKEMDRKP